MFPENGRLDVTIKCYQHRHWRSKTDKYPHPVSVWVANPSLSKSLILEYSALLMQSLYLGPLWRRGFWQIGIGIVRWESELRSPK